MIQNLVTYDENGLQIPLSLQTITDAIIQEYIIIYNLPNDTDFSADTPDGQSIINLGLIVYEFYQILLKVFSACDLSIASGADLDRIITIIGNIRRKGGQFTTQNVDITVDRIVTLNGLDTNASDLNATAYTVQDSGGQQFLLLSTITLNPGTYTLSFRAKDYGQILTSPNTITSAVDIIAGVTNINNLTSQSTLGQDEEVDTDLRIRADKLAKSNAGNATDKLESAISNINEVTDVIVWENDTSTATADGIPPNCIWAVVEGGTDTNVSETIFQNLTAGVQMKGTILVDVIKRNGQSRTIKFDRPITQNLFVKFNIRRSKPNQNFALQLIREYIAKNVAYSIGQVAETSALIRISTDAINSLGGGGYVLDLFISTDGTTWTEYIETTTKQHKFTLPLNNISATIVV